MKHKRPLIEFMYMCLQYEEIVHTWGITRIQVAENMVSFDVSGFNFCGEIIVTLRRGDQSFVIRTTREYIGSANNAMDAIKLLDSYIEYNEDRYSDLLKSLIQ